MTHDDETTTVKGTSLARGPALILGTVLLISGLFLLYKQHDFPPLSQFPSHAVAAPSSKVFFHIFGVNGWSGELTALAGGVLLFGAAQHLLAKAASLIVAVALGLVAILALINHNHALGLFYASDATMIAWGAASALLLFNTVIPRPRKTVSTAQDARVETVGVS